MSVKKIGLFFGAGAEVCYGLPSGGKFALEIFRQDISETKNILKKQISEIDRTSVYAAKWLPKGYDKQRIHAFGRGEFSSLLQSTIEYKRNVVTNFLDTMDSFTTQALDKVSLELTDLETAFHKCTGKTYGSVDYSQSVRLNDRLGASNTKLFSQNSFSAILEVYSHHQQDNLLVRTLRSFLELLVGCYGQQLTQSLNQEIFEDAPEYPVFDDISGLFQIEMSKAGITALELILDEKSKPVDKNSEPEVIFGEFSRSLLELLIEHSLDYQELLDSHFRYLYSPNTNWAKFTKIIIFLYCVQSYIKEEVEKNRSLIEDGPGYYHDLKNFKAKAKIEIVGTSNYNNLIVEAGIQDIECLSAKCM